jgi:hypothetical protein
MIVSSPAYEGTIAPDAAGMRQPAADGFRSDPGFIGVGLGACGEGQSTDPHQAGESKPLPGMYFEYDGV